MTAFTSILTVPRLIVPPPPMPTLPLSATSTRIESTPAPPAFNALVKLTALVLLRNVFRSVTVPVNVRTPEPVPVTVTPPALTAERVPPPDVVNVMSRLPIAESTSTRLMELKSTAVVTSSSTAIPTGRLPLLIGSSFTASTLIPIVFDDVAGTWSAAHAKILAARRSLAVAIVPPPVMSARKMPSSDVNRIQPLPC